MEKKFEITDRILEYGIYIYTIFMFLSRGEGIRNTIIFGSFGLWLLTVRHRNNLHILKSPVSVLCFLYAAVSLLSLMFSIDPVLSLKAFKGDILKFALLFPVIATVMTEKTRLENIAVISLVTMLFIVASGYYSYILYDLEMMKPNTLLVHAWHNKFAQYINTFLSISFILYFVWRKHALRVILAASFLVSIFALILSTSRGGYIAFFSIAVIWSLYIHKLEKFNVKKFMAFLIIIVLTVGVFSFFYYDDVRQRMSSTSTQIYSFNERTEIWSAALYAISKRPVLGWGLGDSIFHQDEPYRGTPYSMNPPVKGPHNMFLEVLFHQGVVGLLPFVALILTAVVIFWQEAFSGKDLKNYMLVACISILVGNFIIHNFVESINKSEYLAFVLGLGMAAKGIDENSNN